jgi:hypothetical protein
MNRKQIQENRERKRKMKTRINETIKRIGQKTMATVGLTLALAIPAFAAEVTFKTSIKESAAGHCVYRMEQPTLSKGEALDKCANVLTSAGVTREEKGKFMKMEDRFAFMGERIQASINKNGTELYYTNFPALKLTEQTGPLPSDKEALEMAVQFLEQSGLMPGNGSELKVDHVGGIMQCRAIPEKSFAPEKKAVVVYFCRELDGLRVMNYGSSITVTLGDAPVPVGVQYHWREVSSAEEVTDDMTVNAISIPELIEADVNRVFSGDSKVTIDKIELVLYDNGGEFIQPAYCYRGKSRNSNDGKEVPVLGYVPALSNPPELVCHPGFTPGRPDSFKMMDFRKEVKSTGDNNAEKIGR